MTRSPRQNPAFLHSKHAMNETNELMSLQPLLIILRLSWASPSIFALSLPLHCPSPHQLPLPLLAISYDSFSHTTHHHENPVFCLLAMMIHCRTILIHQHATRLQHYTSSRRPGVPASCCCIITSLLFTSSASLIISAFILLVIMMACQDD